MFIKRVWRIDTYKYLLRTGIYIQWGDDSTTKLWTGIDANVK